MSQSKNRGPGNKPVEKAPGSKTIDRAPKWSWAGFIIASAVIAIILIIFGVFYYQERVAPFQRPIITIDDTTINIDYFLRRVRLAGADPVAMLETLTKEQFIKLGAPQYGIEVSPDDINQTLRTTSNTTSESEFKAWYRQTLNENKLSDSEFKDIIATGILSARLQMYLAERMATVAEQVHLHSIALATLEEAEKTRLRWEAGEDFADLAREVSLDPASRETEGDLGWFPRGILSYVQEYDAFNLSVGNVSEPSPYYESDPLSDPDADPDAPPTYYFLLMVSERETRELDEDKLRVLRSGALERWILTQYDVHKVDARLNSETYAWLSRQLAK